MGGKCEVAIVEAQNWRQSHRCVPEKVRNAEL